MLLQNMVGENLFKVQKLFLGNFILPFLKVAGLEVVVVFHIAIEL